jgi:uncharacterized membrane protein YkgB
MLVGDRYDARRRVKFAEFRSRGWPKADAIFERDSRWIALFHKAFPWAARGALFVVFFWFGVVKLIGLSEAAPLARALTAKTIGTAHFEAVFNVLAVLECVIGVLCLIPRAVRLAIVLLLFHMAVVCSPLVLVPELTWQAPLVPTMAGQYIIKNFLVVAAALGLAAHASPRPTARGFWTGVTLGRNLS